jgi:hypothetical protein
MVRPGGGRTRAGRGTLTVAALPSRYARPQATSGLVGVLILSTPYPPEGG